MIFISVYRYCMKFLQFNSVFLLNYYFIITIIYTNYEYFMIFDVKKGLCMCEYPENIKEIITKLEDNYLSENYKENVQLSSDLIAETNNSSLLAMGYFYLFKSFFNLLRIRELLEIYPKTIYFLKQNNKLDKLIDIYIDFAIIAQAQNNPVLSFENYLNALEIAEELSDSRTIARIYEYIGHLYCAQYDYVLSIKYYKQSLELLEALENNLEMNLEFFRVHASLTFCYIMIESMEDVIEHFTLMENYAILIPNNPYQLLYTFTTIKYLFFCEYYTPTDLENAHKLLLSQLKNTKLLATLSLCFGDYCESLKKINSYNFMINFIDMGMALIPNELKYTHILKLMPYKIDYYKSIGDNVNYQNCLFEYYLAKQEMKKVISRFAGTVIDTTLKLNELNLSNIKQDTIYAELKEKSETDSLTGLFNYSQIKKLLDYYVNYCNLKNIKLGLSMIDLDFFKQYNDNYGHQLGDIAIQTVSSIMKEFSCDKVICARYGGDEFIMLFIDMNDEDILIIAQQINEKLYSKKITHYFTDTGYFSISQGIVNSVPNCVKSPLSYIELADKALYEIKKIKRGEIRLVNS